MAKPFREWTVLPHGKLIQLGDDLLSVTGLLNMPPMGEVSRRMTVVRLADGRGVIYSAISLDEAEMRELEAFARPAFLIVPSAIHRMDARPWKSRYPTIQVITPAGAREKVQEVVDVDATTVDFGDPSVRFFAVPGTGNGDAALVIERAGGTTLVLNDIIFDLENRPGLKGWLFRKVGMTADEPHIPTPIRLLGVKDKGALATQLEAWGRLPELRRVIISHGDIIAEQPGEVLTRVARDLRSV